MKLPKFALALLLSATFAASSAYAQPAEPAMESNGVIASSRNNMTLYTFDKDVSGSGMSTCNGPCATNWPPYAAMDDESASGDYSIIVRDDGRKQWALKGKPLYYWSKDEQPGDTTGDGFNNVWHVAKP